MNQVGQQWPHSGRSMPVERCWAEDNPDKHVSAEHDEGDRPRSQYAKLRQASAEQVRHSISPVVFASRGSCASPSDHKRLSRFKLGSKLPLQPSTEREVEDECGESQP